MFTGLVETSGTVKTVRNASKALTIGVTPLLSDYSVKPGDSVAVNGTCLTVESSSQNELFFTAVHETLSKTTLARVRTGDTVNLERSLRPADRLGGHFVLGHVDGVGRLQSDRRDGEAIVRTVWVPQAVRPFMAPKGSVAVDGVSLTVVDVGEETISVSLIPFTLSSTTMGTLKVGASVNIECDVLARYTKRLLEYGREGATPAETQSAGGNLLSRMEQLGF